MCFKIDLKYSGLFFFPQEESFNLKKFKFKKFPEVGYILNMVTHKISTKTIHTSIN